MFLKVTKLLYYGDWGLGIGDWAQSPIPNPHPQIFVVTKFILLIDYYNMT